MYFKKKLTVKIFFSYIFIILFSFLFLAFILNKSLEKNTLHDIKASLVNQGNLILNQLSLEEIKKRNIGYLDAFAGQISRKINCRLTIISPEGRVIADSRKKTEELEDMENHANRPEIVSALDGQIGQMLRYSSTLQIDMFYVAMPIIENNRVIGVLRLALPLENIKEMWLSLKKTVTLSFIFAVLLAFILSVIFSLRIVRPIKKIISSAKRFSEGNFGRKIFLDSSDEIGELASALNKMAGEIEEKIKRIEVQNEQLKAVFQSMIEGIIVLDKDGRITSFNSTAEKIFNTTLKDCKDKYILEMTRNNDIAQIAKDVLSKSRPISLELSLMWPKERVFKINATPILEKNIAIGCLLVIHDITEIRRLETIRKDFVANVSHELKTPLTSIKGFVETLLEGGALEDKENSRNFLKIIQEQAERLGNLINDLLDLSSIESGKSGIRKELINIKQLSQEVVLRFSAKIKQKKIEIKNEYPDDLMINADRNKIEQVLVNLIDNAIKFNKEKGEVILRAEASPDSIKFYVEDSGAGIPEKDLSRIFERFYRVDKARSRELGGTGLGLAIVKHIIELHGGQVGVESIEALGSKFYFSIPR